MTINLPVPAAPGGSLATAGATPPLRPLLARLREGPPQAVPQDVLAALAHLVRGHADGDGGAPTAAGGPDRSRFLADVRRLWMHSAARRRPHALLMVSVNGDGEIGEARERLAAVFRALTTVYAWDGAAYAMVLPGTTLRQAVAIAEATRRAVGADPGRRLHAGVALLSTEDDPSATVSLAARCLAIAAESPVGKVVSEADPEARAPAASARRPVTLGAFSPPSNSPSRPQARLESGHTAARGPFSPRR